jgi:hypothetical protein
LDQNHEEKDNDDDESSISKTNTKSRKDFPRSSTKLQSPRSAYRAGRYLEKKVSGRKIKRSTARPPKIQQPKKF